MPLLHMVVSCDCIPSLLSKARETVAGYERMTGRGFLIVSDLRAKEVSNEGLTIRA